jgi:hypothetical protein
VAVSGRVEWLTAKQFQAALDRSRRLIDEAQRKAGGRQGR